MFSSRPHGGSGRRLAPHTVLPVDAQAPDILDIRAVQHRIVAGIGGVTLIDTRSAVLLHEGEVTYGNIGTHSRLEFTVIGEATKFAARVASKCEELGVSVVASEAVAGQFPERFDSLGTFQLRGVEGHHELFSLNTAQP
jgi:class 3 adenylate cyclase